MQAVCGIVARKHAGSSISETILSRYCEANFLALRNITINLVCASFPISTIGVDPLDVNGDQPLGVFVLFSAESSVNLPITD